MYLERLPKSYKLPGPAAGDECMRTFQQNKYVRLKWTDPIVRTGRLAAAKERVAAAKERAATAKERVAGRQRVRGQRGPAATFLSSEGSSTASK